MGQAPRQEGLQNTFYVAGGKGDQINIAGAQHLRQRPGDRPANQGVHAQILQAGGLAGRIVFRDLLLDLPGNSPGFDVADKNPTGHIENR